MLPLIIEALQAFDTPTIAVRVGFTFVASYYLLSFIFIPANRADPKGWAKQATWLHKNGVFDWVTSVIWLMSAVVLILSFIDFVIRKKITLNDALKFYALFIFLFAFVYRLLDWHLPGMLSTQHDGWAGEVAALTLSVGAITGGDFGKSRPNRPLTELISSAEAILGILFIAIFIAKAVAELPR